MVKLHKNEIGSVSVSVTVDWVGNILDGTP